MPTRAEVLNGVDTSSALNMSHHGLGDQCGPWGPTKPTVSKKGLSREHSS